MMDSRSFSLLADQSRCEAPPSVHQLRPQTSLNARLRDAGVAGRPPKKKQPSRFKNRICRGWRTTGDRDSLVERELCLFYFYLFFGGWGVSWL